MNNFLKGIFSNDKTSYDTCAPYNYPEVDRTAEDVQRYFPGEDGYWHRSGSADSGEAVLCCVGDLMGEPQIQIANKYGDTYFFHPCFKYVRDILKASDFTIGNLETTVTDSTPYAGEHHRIDGKYHCNAPEAYLDALRYAGFDAFVNANNHNCDSRAAGLIETNNALDRHGFMHTGTFNNVKQERVLFAEVNGIRLAVISYATHFNRNDSCFTQLGRSVLLNKYDKTKARQDVAYARQKGAEFVLVYIHWGKEYTHTVNDLQRKFAKELADCGVDYIVGSHTHCLQAREFVTSDAGKIVPVVYSMGNFITNENKDISKHSGILQLRLKKTETEIAVEENFIPCFVYKKFDASHYAPVPTTKETTVESTREFLAKADKYIREVMCIDNPVEVCQSDK